MRQQRQVTRPGQDETEERRRNGQRAEDDRLDDKTTGLTKTTRGQDEKQETPQTRDAPTKTEQVMVSNIRKRQVRSEPLMGDYCSRAI